MSWQYMILNAVVSSVFGIIIYYVFLDKWWMMFCEWLYKKLNP